MIRLAVLVFACVLAARIATPVVLIAVDLCIVFEIRGTSALIIVQLLRDLAALFVVVGVGAFFLPALAMQMLGFAALAALCLAVGEPFLSARSDTVVAAWQMPRLIGRLSAALFAFTLAAGVDAFPRGRLRSLATWLTAALASPLLAFSKQRWAWRSFARVLGLRAVLDVEGAFSAAPATFFERAALLAVWPTTLPFPAPFTPELGVGARITHTRDRDGRYLFA